MLYSEDAKKWGVRVRGDGQFHTHRGIVKLSEAIGKRYGEALYSSLGHAFWLLRPTTFDYIMHVARKTQIVYPKDMGFAILRLGLSPGMRVIEAGTGSGAATIAAATSVMPTGHVYSYEIREDFARLAMRNVERAGLSQYVTIKAADARLGFDEEGVDAVIIDLGEPWLVIPHAYKALKGGCPLASFSPTINQVERTVKALRENNFVDVQTVEVFYRSLKVEEGKTRPHTRMIGHTCYMTFGTKIIR